MKKICHIVLATLAVVTVACTKALDSEKQLGALGSDTYYANATDNDALALITSLYLSAEGNMGGMDSYTDDIASPSSYGDVNADGFSGGLSLSTLYQINYKANLIIENMQPTSEEKKRVIAEAYFFRGWAYFNLIRGWGTPPLVDHVLTSDELEVGNASQADLWAFVHANFDEAIATLPAKSSKGRQRSLGARVTKEVALAYKGKSYLYAGDNENAAKTLKQIIDGKAELIIENHSITTAHTALQVAQVARDYDPILLEEPADPQDIHDYERLRASTDIPLATGERIYTRRGFAPFLQGNLLDVLQPDLGNCGGITEGRKIADLAELYGVSVQTHTCNTALSVAIALHLEAAIPNFFIHEHHTSNTFQHNREDFIHDYQPVNGYFELPNLPGLGNEPTEKTIAESEIITVK